MRHCGPTQGCKEPRLRVVAVCTLIVAAACAAAPPRPSAEAEELKELRAQLNAQSSLVAQQQRRLEELEIKLAALQARAAPQQPAVQQKAVVPVPSREPAAPAHVDPRPPLKTVKLGGRRPRVNPVERAPRLPATLELREPDDEALSILDQAIADPDVQREAVADLAWARAVQRLNEGDHAHAETEFLAFAAAHPRHTAADNALYLAGLVREVRGDCEGALPLLESVERRYPAGDAVPMAELELGRCLRILDRRPAAKDVLMKLVKEHGDVPEAAQAQRLLQGL